MYFDIYTFLEQCADISFGVQEMNKMGKLVTPLFDKTEKAIGTLDFHIMQLVISHLYTSLLKYINNYRIGRNFCGSLVFVAAFNHEN